MPRKVNELVAEAKQLPYGDRAALVEQLIAASANDLDPKIEQAWGDEAMRRVAEIKSGKVQGIPGEQVSSGIRRIIGR